jgi:hypothetical protein
MIVIKAPEEFPPEVRCRKVPSLFLGGTCLGGWGTPHGGWRHALIEQLEEIDQLAVLDPYRPDWGDEDVDPDWRNDIEAPKFLEQLVWERAAMAIASYRLFVFEAGAKGALTMLELGLSVSRGANHVVVESGFWAKGNVEYTVLQQPGAGLYATVAEFGRHFRRMQRLMAVQPDMTCPVPGPPQNW